MIISKSVTIIILRNLSINKSIIRLIVPALLMISTVCCYSTTTTSIVRTYLQVVKKTCSDFKMTVLEIRFWYNKYFTPSFAGLVGSVRCVSDWRPGGCGFDPCLGRQHSLVEIDHEIFSTVILSLPLIQEGQLSVSGERMCTILVNCLED